MAEIYTIKGENSVYRLSWIGEATTGDDSDAGGSVGGSSNIFGCQLNKGEGKGNPPGFTIFLFLILGFALWRALTLQIADNSPHPPLKLRGGESPEGQGGVMSSRIIVLRDFNKSRSQTDPLPRTNKGFSEE